MGKVLPVRVGVPGDPLAAAEAKAVAGKLKRLLLQLPAFREAGLAPSPEPAVRNLDDILALLLQQGQDDPGDR